MDNFELEQKIGFLEEAEQALAETEPCFMDLETSKKDLSVIDKILRLAHNLKGSAQAVGFDKMSEFAHEVELLILTLKQNESPITTEMIRLLLQCNDQMIMMVDTLKGDMNASLEFGDLIIQIKSHYLNSATATINVMIVECANQKYVIPLHQVQECVRPQQSDVKRLTDTEESLYLRGENIPLYRLWKLLNLKESLENTMAGVAIVIRTQDGPFSILVDDIIGQQRVVVNKSRSATLADGRPALLLEPKDLIEYSAVRKKVA